MFPLFRDRIAGLSPKRIVAEGAGVCKRGALLSRFACQADGEGRQAVMLLALLLAVAAPAACTYDRAAMIALPFEAFDQDMAAGWRGLSTRGCEAAAADLIRDWRVANASERNASLLFWHEG